MKIINNTYIRHVAQDDKFWTNEFQKNICKRKRLTIRLIQQA